MSIVIRKEFEKDPNMMRAAMCDTLIDLAANNKNIVAMDADTMGSSGLKPFFKAYPEQFINCGISEANMIGLACGMSATGKVPFVHTFGPFASRRVYDQVFLSGAYAKSTINIIGSDPGVTAAYNGGTHMPFEDMGILRCIPEITLVEPCDCAQTKSVIKSLAGMDGVHYIRLMRKNPVAVFEDGSEFEIGKAALLRPGKDVTIIASGIMVSEALKAAATLANEGIDARVLNMFTWKPLDMEAVAAAALDTGAIVTCENHNILCGLGSAVCEAVCSMKPVPVERVGINDVFGEVGTEGWLKEHFNLNAANIIAHAKKAIARK